MQPYNDDLVNDRRPSLSFYIYFTFLPLKSRRHKKKWKEEKEIGGEKIKKERKKREREREIKGELGKGEDVSRRKREMIEHFDDDVELQHPNISQFHARFRYASL